jgi:ATP-dependent DNA ligase
MADPTPLNRNQIAAFVGNDPDAIRAIERLFKVAGQLTPADIATLTQLIVDNTLALGAADNKAEVALSEAFDAKWQADLAVFDDTKAEVAMSVAAEAKRLADLAATAPAPLEQRLDQLQDVRAFSPAGGSILIYNAAQQAWLPAVGASGSFTAASGETITVVDGIITSIV